MKRYLRTLAWICAAAAMGVPAVGQVFDNTGNGMLSGDYYFRHGIWFADSTGTVNEAITIYGTITFNGKGNYSIAGVYIDSAQGSSTYSPTGTYTISASGYGYLNFSGVLVRGMISNGVFIGSSPDDSFNNVFVAVKATTTTNAIFKGEYRMAYLNYPTGYYQDNYDALATLNADGAGNLGSVSLKYYVAASGNTATTQTLTGVKYAFSNGTGVITFPTSTKNFLAIQGQHLLLISPDGNFIFGGSTFDFFVGVRHSTSNPPPFSGLYYLAGMNQTLNDAATSAEMDTYFGSLTATNGTIIGHQRFFSAVQSSAQNYTYTDSAPDTPVADYVNGVTSTEYFLSPDGHFRIGFGQGPYLGLSAAVQAPAFSGSGVYLNPAGIVNGASFAPFTAGIARGELLTLYGSNLANSDLTIADTLPLPTTLDGVQVKINNRLAPIYYVSPGQISAIVPYGTSESIAQIQVFKNNVASNAVTLFVYESAPGVFTVPAGGAGYGAVLHNSDYTLVSTDNPAHVGDYLQVYLTGLGDVFPSIQDGAPGPTGNNLSTAQNITAYVDLVEADPLFAGLAPTLPALYQVNLQVPDGVQPGDVFLDISGPGAYTSQAMIPVAGAASSARLAAAGIHRRR